MAGQQDHYLSVDVETSGPAPGLHSLLSIGACVVCDPQEMFYIELKPVHLNFIKEALQVSGLDMARLQRDGADPAAAMQAFEDWIRKVTPPDRRPVFVAFNAPFDWMFVNDYFQRYLGHNPFGYSALDMKAYFSGLTGCDFHQTSLRTISDHYQIRIELAHHARQDAIDQASVFRRMLQESGRLE